MGALAFVFFFYGDALLSPNSYLFSGKGDAIKNYFTYASHIKNNKSLTNFEGFNYPYGESFLYTDGHPLLTSILKPVHSIFPEIADYSIGILNMLMLLSLLGSALVLFYLLRELKINTFLAILGAWAILILAPQIFRIQGHFALSYSFVIPLCFFWLLRYIGSDNKTKHLLFLTIFHSLLLFIHAYLGIISISILLAYFLVGSILNRFKKRKHWLIFGSTIVSMVPFLLVKSLSDFHQFRTTNPYGFFEYYADLDTIILPHHGILKNFIFNLLPNFTQTWEGWAYLGIGPILLSPFIAFHFFKNFKKAELLPLNKLLLAAGLLLLFSFGFPFRFGSEELLDYLPILKQFRAIGRFAWVFYFALSIYTFYLLNFWTNKGNSKAVKIALTLFVPILMISEGIPYHIEVGSSINQEKNSFKKENLESGLSIFLNNIDPSQFQAIVPIPYYNIGSENYVKEASDDMYTKSMLFSYHTGLPLTSNHSARTSLKESRNAMEFFAPNFYKKAIEADLKSTLPFLVVFNKNDKTNASEQKLLKSVKWLKETDELSIGLLPYNSVFENTAQQEIDAFLKDTTLIKSNGFLVSDTAKYFYYHKQTAVAYGKTYFRNKNYSSIKQQKRNKLVQLNSSFLKVKNSYEASLWVSNGSKNGGQDDLNHLEYVLEEKDLNGEILQTIRLMVMETFIHHSGWSLVQLEFSPLASNSTLEFYLDGNSPIAKSTFWADFLLRQQGLDVYKILEGKNSKPAILFKNNHSIKTYN